MNIIDKYLESPLHIRMRMALKYDKLRDIVLYDEEVIDKYLTEIGVECMGGCTIISHLHYLNYQICSIKLKLEGTPISGIPIMDLLNKLYIIVNVESEYRTFEIKP